MNLRPDQILELLLTVLVSINYVESLENQWDGCVHRCMEDREFFCEVGTCMKCIHICGDEDGPYMTQCRDKCGGYKNLATSQSTTAINYGLFTNSSSEKNMSAIAELNADLREIASDENVSSTPSIGAIIGILVGAVVLVSVIIAGSIKCILSNRQRGSVGETEVGHVPERDEQALIDGAKDELELKNMTAKVSELNTNGGLYSADVHRYNRNAYG